MGRPEHGKLQIAADDEYELYVNGRRVGAGGGKTPDDYDLSRYLIRGKNVIAVKVLNKTAGDAALAVRVVVKDAGGTYVSHASDGSWKTTLKQSDHWMKFALDDSHWLDAQSFGRYGEESPEVTLTNGSQPDPSVTATAARSSSQTRSPSRTQPPSQEEPSAERTARGVIQPINPSGRAPAWRPKEKQRATAAGSRDDAKEFAAPDGGEPSVETQQVVETGRFKTPPEFEVEWVINPEKTGSLIAMTFNEEGQIIASREGGPLLLISDADKDTVLDTVSTYCDEVKNCQGMLALNGDVLAVGDGPDGAALYRLSDEDHDGNAEKVRTIFKFKGGMSEHGPHTVTLGPDGLLYVLVGNHGAVEHAYSKNSPHHDFYEGDLVQPRYEDPQGHAAGVKAPGAIVLRTDLEGKRVELVAGGLRNPYDFAFNLQGELLTCDADMEWDYGLPWYRPTRVNHITPGAEFGWRSGWAKWPDYYIDSLPAVVDVGPGSPTGVAFYNHFMYPLRFHGAMFVGDWSMGRINVVNFKRSGGTYTATVKVFVEGRPLNITDLEVGPDGWLYFCTGGRGTSGGVYRVIWNRNVPAEMADVGTGITRAIRQPQPHSAWGRQRIAEIQEELGDQWGPKLQSIAAGQRFEARYRVRALDLLHLFGPAPSAELVTDLVRDPEADVRAKAAYLMGLRDDDDTRSSLVQMLRDNDGMVRRVACESLVRRGQPPTPDQLLPLLADTDRFVSYTARRALELTPPDRWRETVFSTNETRVFLQGATALLVAHPDKETASRIIDRVMQYLNGRVNDPHYPRGFVSDENFTHMMRIIQLALLRGDISIDGVPDLAQFLAVEFPSANPNMNREMIRILAYLKQTTITPRFMRVMAGNQPLAEKMQLAMYAPHLAEGLSTSQKLKLLEFYEEARAVDAGLSVPGYVDQVSRDFVASFTQRERERVFDGAEKWPNCTLAMLARMPQELDEKEIERLIKLDEQLKGRQGKAFDRLRVGILAVLARSGTDGAMQYLRDLYATDPQRRTAIAIGLAQQPDDENWPLLVSSITTLEGGAAREVFTRLCGVDRVPDEPESIRQVILSGLRSPDTVGPVAVELLAHWTGEEPNEAEEPIERELAVWQEWFAATYPDHLPAQLPVDSPSSKWTFQELLTFLESDEGTRGDALRGAKVFESAQCVKCHRFGNVGEPMGPNLTNVVQRFQKKEILESILFPSQIISDQYAAKKVLTTGGRIYVGIMTPAGADSVFILQSTGEKAEIQKSEIEDQLPSHQSAMPDGLLDKLTQQEIADLFAYLNRIPRTAVTDSGAATSR